MKTRIGENMGPVDWSHEIASDMPAIWREAERHPENFLFWTSGGFMGRDILQLCMYDGWPYWTPRPAIQFMGPMGPEWNFFDSYGVNENSIKRKPEETP